METPGDPLSGQATTQPDDAMLAAVQSRIAQRQAQAPQQQPVAGGQATGDPMLAAVQARIAARQGQSQPNQAGQPQGPTISANTNEGFHAEDLSSDPFARAGLKIATPFAKKAMDAIDKLREVQNFTQEGRQEHPIQAHLGDIANKLEGFLFGNQEHPEAAIGTGKYGMLTNPVLAATTGPEAGESVINAARELRGGSEAAGEAPGIIKQVMQGKGVAQEPAKAAVRKFVGAEPDAAMLEGHESVADEMLSSLQKQKQAAYEKVDKAAGFDVKETRHTLKDAEYKIKQPEIDDAAKARLQKNIDEMKSRLGEAEKKIGPDDLKAADTANQKWRAAKDFRRVLTQATSEDGESLKIDTLLNSLKRLRNDPKFGDRLEQIAGKDGAEGFVEELRQAKESGIDAMNKQRIAKMVGKWIGGGIVGGAAAGAGYELLK